MARKRVDTAIYTDDRGRLSIRVQGYNVRPNQPPVWVDHMLTVGTVTLDEARRLRDRIVRDLSAGRYLRDRYAGIRAQQTLRDIFEDLVEARAQAGRKRATLEHWSLYGRKFLEDLGTLRIDELDYLDLKEWWNEMQARETPHACNQSLTLLRATLRHAVALGLRQSNPAASIPRVRVRRAKRDEPLTLEHWQRMAAWLLAHDAARCREAMPKRRDARYMGHFAYALTQVSLAARGAEVCGLMWEDIDREKMRVTLRDTKTAPTLVRPLSPELLLVIDHHRVLWSQFGPCPHHDSSYVFPAASGERAKATQRIIYTWHKMMRTLGYPTRRREGGWTPHDLRGLGINLMYVAGGTTREVMEFVGHTTATAHARYLRAEPRRQRMLSGQVAKRLISVFQERI